MQDPKNKQNVNNPKVEDDAAQVAKEATPSSSVNNTEDANASDAAATNAPADAADDAAATNAPAADPLEAARKEAADWQDRYMRLHAEWDTYRRRTAEQRNEERARATEKLIEGLLPIMDDFERTIDYAAENGETGLLDGVKAVSTKLTDALVKGGLEVIDPKGEAFDALEAQAVGTVPDPSVFDETVVDVFQKGYKLGNKVLRPAMVTISTGGAQRPKKPEEE